MAIAHIENKIAVEEDTIRIDTFIKDLSDSIIYALADDDKLKFKVSYNLEEATIKNVNTTMIGLILNELITNTTKYAFDNFDSENILTISCSINGKILKLEIMDNGKGYSIENDIQAKSLGIELVREMVKQLNAKIITNTSKGTENIIEIPI